MLSHLILSVESGEKDLSYRSGSRMQGVLMEQVSSEVANQLHHLQVNPYSQWIETKDNRIYWHITGMNEFAYQEIIQPLSQLQEFQLDNREESIQIVGHKLETVKRSLFIEENLFADPIRCRKIDFVTATSFRSDNRYIIFPETRLIFQSLMNKLEGTGKEDIFSYELLEEICNHNYISSYRLRSTNYPLEKVRIASFIGSISFALKGPKELTNICNLLLSFAEYSGIGIKTSMGMGAIVSERR